MSSADLSPVTFTLLNMVIDGALEGCSSDREGMAALAVADLVA